MKETLGTEAYFLYETERVLQDVPNEQVELKLKQKRKDMGIHVENDLSPNKGEEQKRYADGMEYSFQASTGAKF